MQVNSAGFILTLNFMLFIKLEAVNNNFLNWILESE